MAGKRFSAEQIIMKLREAEVGLAGGQTVEQAAKPESVHPMQKGIICLTPQNSLWPLSGLLTPRTTTVSTSFLPLRARNNRRPTGIAEHIDHCAAHV